MPLQGPPHDEERPDHLETIRAAMIDARGLAKLPVPEPLIENVLFRDTLAWLFGPPGCGKSFIALDMAGCVATGEPWQGFRVRRGTVLYVIAEGASGTYERVRAWEASMGREMTGVIFLPMAIQAADALQWAAFIQAAREVKPALIILDTQARVTVGMEENSALDMGKFIHRIEALRAGTGACVLPVHHSGRVGDHLRGSMALDGAANSVFRVKRTDEMIEITCVKQKDAPEFEPLSLRLTPYEGSAIVAATGAAKRSACDAPAARRTVALWWDAFATDWVSVSILSETIGIDRGTIYRYMKAQINAGLVEKKGEASATRYRLLHEPPSQSSQQCS
jgi:hypothetical protein